MDNELLKNQILEDIKRLILLNYSINEIVSIISQNYKVEPALVYEIIRQEFSLIYSIYRNVNNILLFFGFLSLLIVSTIFSINTFTIFSLSILFYLTVLLDYFSFSGKINITLSYFLITIVFFIFFVISLFTLLGKFYPVSFIIVLSLIIGLIKFFKDKSSNILRFSRLLIRYFEYTTYLINITFFVVISFIISSFFVNFPLNLVFTLIISLLITFLYFKFIIKNDYYAKWSLLFVFIIFLSLTIKVIFVIKEYIDNSLETFQNTYSVSFNYSYNFFSFNYWNLTLENCRNTYFLSNQTEFMKKVRITRNVIKKSCKPEITEFFKSPKNYFEYVLIKSLENSEFIKLINKKLEEIVQRVKSRDINCVNEENYKEYISKWLVINYFTCQNENQR